MLLQEDIKQISDLLDSKLQVATDKVVDRITVSMATKNELAALEAKVDGFTELVQGVLSSNDAAAGRVKDLDSELSATIIQVNEHEQWLKNINPKARPA